jgi:hypothetical protein
MTSRSRDAVASPPSLRERANAEVLERLWASEPVLVDVRPALDVVPGMTPETVLTSGAPLAWDDYYGGQRSGLIGGALYEGLAGDAEEAGALIRAGKIRIATCNEHS